MSDVTIDAVTNADFQSGLQAVRNECATKIESLRQELENIIAQRSNPMTGGKSIAPKLCPNCGSSGHERC